MDGGKCPSFQRRMLDAPREEAGTPETGTESPRHPWEAVNGKEALGSAEKTRRLVAVEDESSTVIASCASLEKDDGGARETVVESMAAPSSPNQMKSV